MSDISFSLRLVLRPCPDTSPACWVILGSLLHADSCPLLTGHLLPCGGVDDEM